MDFEEYMATTGMDEQTENSFAWKFYKELYMVGQQSKQAEIDALKAKVQELWTELDDRQSKEYIIEKCEDIIKEILK